MPVARPFFHFYARQENIVNMQVLGLFSFSWGSGPPPEYERVVQIGVFNPKLFFCVFGLLAHSFATSANFQWFLKAPSPLNGMVGGELLGSMGSHWDLWKDNHRCQWFFMVVHHWSDNE